jgi:hypothetical protein
MKKPLLEFHLSESFDENLSQKLRFSWENTCFSSNIFFGRFLAVFARKKRAYGRQFFPANYIFSGTGFELFFIIFGRLATVVG